MTTKCFKIVSGEELLADIVEEDAFRYVISNPAQIAVQPKEDGSMGLMIAQYMPYSEGDVIIFKSAIVSIGTPAEGLVTEYQSRFQEESLIQVPNNKIII
jgi:hypothetical protein